MSNNKKVFEAIFLAAIILAGIVGSLYAVPDFLGKDWDGFVAHLGLKMLQIVFVMSNIHVRQKSQTHYIVAVSMSVMITVGIGVLHYFESFVPVMTINDQGEVVELTKNDQVVKELDYVMLMLLQVLNALVVFSEWSISEMLEEVKLQDIKALLVDKFEKGLAIKADQIEEANMALYKWVEGVFARHKNELNTKKLEIKNLSDRLAVEESNRKAAENAKVFEDLTFMMANGDTDGAKALLESYTPSDFEGKTRGKISYARAWLLLRRQIAGDYAMETRISGGPNMKNEYLYFCSGQPGQVGICPPFTVQTRAASVVCPTCGKVHALNQPTPPTGVLRRIDKTN